MKKPMENSNLKNASILIVDDEQANIDILTGLLEIKGYNNVYPITDPRLVLSLFQEIKPDIILLDLMMPHLNGFQVMEQLKPLFPENTYLPILVLTADVTAESKLRALAGGAKDFLTKPFDLTEVDLRITNLLQTRLLHIQLQNQNVRLEEKVLERTIRLRDTIIALEISKTKAEESDRLKSAFLANMSHEIRTPMNGILGFAELLNEPDLTGEQRQDYIKIIGISGTRMLNIINDIISISKIESGQMGVSISETNINEQILYIHTFFKPEVEQNGLQISFRNTLPARGSIIKTDREKIYAILSNLVKNAIKFTKAGSIEFGYEKNDNHLQFFVSDTGIGISPEKQQIVFERFRQGSESLTRNYEGAGLGLSISKAYVEMLGGKIWVDSEIGKGSTFYFTLPYHTQTEDKIVTKNVVLADVEIKPESKLKILIAEDDQGSEILLSLAVEKFSKNIFKARNGIEAVEICRNNTDIDLVLMDIKMPEMDGYEATRRIRQFNKDLVIVAQTAFALTGDRERAMEAGCNDYISKPIKKDKLMELMQKYF